MTAGGPSATRRRVVQRRLAQLNVPFADNYGKWQTVRWAGFRSVYEPWSVALRGNRPTSELQVRC
ncbi:hypothetical protein OG858_26145 [Streptomyces europaeiscabiei]|nr:hypothetical protein [Streptomyces europaeiscabiei]WUD34542.1 hypothetical protein OG858_26145 [Streptomyces europaeiscabiei]